MGNIEIDGKAYNVEKMAPEARQLMGNLQFVEAEIVRRGNQIAALQTARAAYAHALKTELERTV